MLCQRTCISPTTWAPNRPRATSRRSGSSSPTTIIWCGAACACSWTASRTSTWSARPATSGAPPARVRQRAARPGAGFGDAGRFERRGDPAAPQARSRDRDRGADDGAQPGLRSARDRRRRDRLRAQGPGGCRTARGGAAGLARRGVREPARGGRPRGAPAHGERRWPQPPRDRGAPRRSRWATRAPRSPGSCTCRGGRSRHTGPTSTASSGWRRAPSWCTSRYDAI